MPVCDKLFKLNIVYLLQKLTEAVFTVIYADILILLNFLVDYFILSASALILKRNPKTVFVILSAFFGGIASLYIFLPRINSFADFSVKLFICALMSLICFGAKKFLKVFFTVFAVTSAYAGIMTAFYHIFKPNGMIVKNSVVYFSISPAVLIVSTVACYVAFAVFAKIFAVTFETAQNCRVTAFFGEKKLGFDAVIDTGNSVCDAFGKSEVIIVDKKVSESLFCGNNKDNSDEMKLRYRVIPCSTVSGEVILDGYRCDSAVIESKKSKITLEKPIIAVSKAPIADSDAVLNPKIFI